MKVAVLVPATSNRRDWTNFKQTDLYNYLFKSFFTTYNKNHNYTFYIGIDDDDKLYNNPDVIEEINKFFSVMINTDINIITFGSEYKGKPCNIWNRLYELSLKENDYFLQIGSDIEFVDCNWCECMIETLKKNDNVGVVGLTDLGRKQYDKNDTLLTQTMVSKKHYEIFGFYFPPELISWFSDNWIGDIYDRYGRKFIIPQRILNKGGEPRYDVPEDCRYQYQVCLEKYLKFLFMKNMEDNSINYYIK